MLLVSAIVIIGKLFSLGRTGKSVFNNCCKFNCATRRSFWLAKSKNLPDFRIGYSQQLLVGGFNPAGINRNYYPGTRIAGFQAGIGVPLFSRGANRARVRSEQLESQVAQANYQSTQAQVRLQYEQELLQYRKYQQVVQYYLTGGLKLTDEQLRIAQVSFNLGEIGYLEYVSNMASALQGKLSYLETVSRLNQSAIQLQYLKGE